MRHQYRQLGIGENIAGGAAEDHLPQAALRIGALDDEVAAEFVGLGEQDLAGGPLAGLDEASRVAVVQRFEEAEPDLFGWVRDATYIAYYENPFVAEAIVLSGHLYELRPHIKGYPVRRFDLVRDTPRHGRGRYTKTSDVRRVDISALDLESNRTQAWGLKR